MALAVMIPELHQARLAELGFTSISMWKNLGNTRQDAMARLKLILGLGDTPAEAAALVQYTCIWDFALTLGSEVEKRAVAADL